MLHLRQVSICVYHVWGSEFEHDEVHLGIISECIVKKLFILLFLQLLDVCTLDIGSMDFDYSILAASALYHVTNEEVTLSVTGEFQDATITIDMYTQALTPTYSTSFISFCT